MGDTAVDQPSVTMLHEGNSAEDSHEILPVYNLQWQAGGSSHDEQPLHLETLKQASGSGCSSVDTLNELKLPLSKLKEMSSFQSVNAPLAIPEQTSLSSSNLQSQEGFGPMRELRDVCLQTSFFENEHETSLSLVSVGQAFTCAGNMAEVHGKSADDLPGQHAISPGRVDASQQTLSRQCEFAKEASDADMAKPNGSPDGVSMKTETKMHSSTSSPKSALTKQDSQAMTLLLITAALPGEADSEGAIRGAGDAQNVDAAESHEANEREGIASMLRPQSKTSCQLEQLLAADHFESLSRLSETQSSPLLHTAISDESNIGEGDPFSTLPAETRALLLENQYAGDGEIQAAPMPATPPQEESRNDQTEARNEQPVLQVEKNVSTALSETPNTDYSEYWSSQDNDLTAVSELQDPPDFQDSVEIPTPSENEPQIKSPDKDPTAEVCNADYGSVPSRSPFLQSASATKAEHQMESIPVSTECVITPGTTSPVAASEKHEPSNKRASEPGSDEDWDIIPLRRTPAHTDLGVLKSENDDQEKPEQILDKDVQEEEENAAGAAAPSPQHAEEEKPSQQEQEALAPKLVTVSIGDKELSEPEETQAHAQKPDESNVKKIPPSPCEEEGIGDLPAPKEEAVMEDTTLQGDKDNNVNNSLSQTSANASTSACTSAAAAKKKKKKRGGKGKKK
jgi:hypothetical protein